MKPLTPKFLTQEVAERAVATALQMMENSPIEGVFRGKACHIVVLAPEMDDHRRGGAEDPDYSIRPHVLYERSVGDRSKWSGPYDNIARGKALQLWQDRNDDRTDCIPHLLFAGDTPYWGGVKRDGLVVACSGVQSWFDRMLSAIVADLCVGLAYDAFKATGEIDFLG